MTPEATKLTKITSVVCFSPRPHPPRFQYIRTFNLHICTNFLRERFPNPFDPETLYWEECPWNLCSVELTLGNTGIPLLQCAVTSPKV